MTHLGEIRGRRVLVWGARIDGTAAVRALSGRNDVRVVVDPVPGQPLDTAEMARVLGVPVSPPSDEVLGWCDLVVRSPIVHPRRAELTVLGESGVTVTTLVDLWMNMPRDQPVLGITGTKGKSTAAAVAALVLEAAGLRVGLGGNMEIPVTELADDRDAYVIEVSSYMATDATVSPRFGVLTNLGADHVNWHGSLAEYRDDKLRLFAHPQLEAVAVNGLDPMAVAATAELPGRTLFGSEGVAVEGLRVVIGPRVLADLADTPLGNRHFAIDVAAAVAGAAFVVGRADAADALPAAVERFQPLPCRLEPVRTLGGVTYVDDTLASNPMGALAALEAFADRPVVMILGGEDRHVDFTQLLDALAARAGDTSLVLISDTTETLDAAAGDREVEAVAVGGQDVGPAVEVAARRARPGGVVLFSPGAPTPRWFGYHTDRSRAFQAAVTALG